MNIDQHMIACLNEFTKHLSQRIITMQKGKIVWHHGSYTDLNATDNSIFCETDIKKMDKYAGFGQDKELNAPNKAAFRTKFELSDDINVLDCEGIGFLAFCNMINGSHDLLKTYLTLWCKHKGVDGLFALNGDLTEMMIINPKLNLKTVNAIELKNERYSHAF